MPQPQCIIMRGVPGSGKSTWLGKNHPNAIVCSADHFFVDRAGKYNFNPKLLGGAHAACWAKFKKYTQTGMFDVAIDNTNLTWKEAGRYIEEALKAGYYVTVVDMKTPVEVAAARNVHGVPADKVAAMAKKELFFPDNSWEHPNLNRIFVEG